MAPRDPSRDWFTSHFRLWGVRALALAAGGISGYLAWAMLTFAPLAGCNPGGGCDQLLAGRWSWWFGMPVPLPAASLYISLFAATLLAGESAPERVRSLMSVISSTLALTAGLTAVWFLVLMIQKRGEGICPYCLVIQLCGLAICGLVFWSVPLVLHRRLGISIAGGGLFALLLAGQYLVNPPQPQYLIHDFANATSSAPSYTLATFQRRPQFKMVTLAGGRIQLEAVSLPTLGSVDSPRQLGLVFDYNCSHCRHLTRELAAIRKDGNPLVVLVPVGEGPEGTELARLALLVYFLEPEKFAEYHAWLTEPAAARTTFAARERADELIGRERVQSWHGMSAIDSQLLANSELTALLSREVKNRHLPKLLLNQSIISGAPQEAAELEKLLRRE